ncbi:hypothetical protein KQI64_06890 [Lachnoclostridium sp. MSJ-17]|nr:hypothetical protein [Lachnoclostridium sp. MSJ-17]
MRIEIKAQSSLFSMGSPGNFNEYFKELCIDKAKDRQQQVAAAFKAVKSNIYNMDGGAGNLEPVVEQIDERVNKIEAQKSEKIDIAVQSLGEFLHTVRMADQRAAQTIGELNAKFYEANPWAVPPPPPKKKSAWQRFKEWCKKAGKAVKDFFKKAVDWVVGVAKKIWTSVKDFVVKHWKAIVKIVVGVIIIAGLAALSVFTGGAAAPLFLLAAKGAAIAAGVGAATTVVAGMVQGKSAGEIFDSVGDAVLVGAVTGAVGGVAGAAAGAVTSATGSQVLGQLTKIGVEMCGKMIAKGTSYLIDHDGSLDGFWNSEGKGILVSAGTSALSTAGDALFDQGKEMLGEAFGGLQDSQLGHAIQKGYDWCQEKMPTITNMVTNAAKDTVGGLSWGDLAHPSDLAKSLGKGMVGNLLGQASGAVGDILTNDLNNITGGTVNSVIDSIKGSDFGQAIGSAVDTVSGAIGDISGQISGAIGDISGQISGAIGDISGQLGGVIGDISGQFKGVAGTIGGIAGDIAGQISGSIPSIQMPSLDGIAGSIGSAVSGAVGGVVGDITGAIGSAVSTTLPALGKIEGALGGIQGNLGLAIDSVTSQSQSVVTVIMPDFSKLGGLQGSLGMIGQAASCAPASLSAAAGATVGSWMSNIRL